MYYHPSMLQAVKNEHRVERKKYHVVPRIDSRAAKMIEMYKEGKTLEQIGDSFSITRERVRQIMTKRGITSKDGGRSIISFLGARDKIEIQKKKREKKESKIRSMLGISLHSYEDIVRTYGPVSSNKSPIHKYRSQKRNARIWGIEWQLTFAEWWNAWQSSGKYEKRGVGSGYVMGRFGDSGPYSLDNIYICTARQNIKDSYLTNPHSNRLKKSRGMRDECLKGHPFPANLHISKGGIRTCKICEKARSDKYRASEKYKLRMLAKRMAKK